MYLIFYTFSIDYYSQCEHRNTVLRGKMKSTTDTNVATQYGLKTPTPGCAERVGMLMKDLAYIYPGDIVTVCRFSSRGWCTNESLQGRIDGSRPFDLDIITAALSSFFRNKKKTPSYASVYAHQFKSSVHLAPHQKEIPEPMLALACAAVSPSYPCTFYVNIDLDPNRLSFRSQIGRQATVRKTPATTSPKPRRSIR